MYISKLISFILFYSALGTGIETNSQSPQSPAESGHSDDESTDESWNSTEFHHPQLESSQEGNREGKFHMDKWPSRKLPQVQRNKPLTNVVDINADTPPDTSPLITFMDLSQIIIKGKGTVTERVCYQSCFIILLEQIDLHS